MSGAGAAPLAPLRDALVGAGLVGPHDPVVFTALTGGVSSDIHRVDVPGRTFCVKRALPRLKVAADWQAPVERNRYERRWLAFAAAVDPACAPAVLGGDDEAGWFAMAWLGPADHPVWKAELLAGRVDAGFAAAVGDTLGRVHAASAPVLAALAEEFPTAALFDALRLEPYLDATARAHPGLAGRLAALRTSYAEQTRALVHGDVSPKNILAGPGGPVFLDAECATVGDPAFDLAFVCNHLVLKARHRPGDAAALRDACDRLVRAYLARVDWEPPGGLEGRAAALLPALHLARVDGKSPVEYLTGEARAGLRRAATAVLGAPATAPTIAATAEALLA